MQRTHVSRTVSTNLCVSGTEELFGYWYFRAINDNLWWNFFYSSVWMPACLLKNINRGSWYNPKIVIRFLNTFFSCWMNICSVLEKKQDCGRMVRVACPVQGRVAVFVLEVYQVLIQVEDPGQFFKVSVLGSPQKSGTWKRKIQMMEYFFSRQ